MVVALELQLIHHRASLETLRALESLQTEIRDRTLARIGPHSRRNTRAQFRRRPQIHQFFIFCYKFIRI